ncbi:MAG TPA: response regulator transcription factor [Polyangiales bacterium]|nr:response regulator transcription factor [Polyangiales bacterium]
MPTLGGAQATERIKESNAKAKVLALSAFEDRGYIQTLMEAGASGFVLKRSAAEELVRALRALALGRIYIDPAVPPEMFSSGRVGAGPQPVIPLSEREAEVLRLSAQGWSMKETAAALDLGIRTVETYKARAMEKLRLRNRADLVRHALKSGWLRDD